MVSLWTFPRLQVSYDLALAVNIGFIVVAMPFAVFGEAFSLFCCPRPVCVIGLYSPARMKECIYN